MSAEQGSMFMRTFYPMVMGVVFLAVAVCSFILTVSISYSAADLFLDHWPGLLVCATATPAAIGLFQRRVWARRLSMGLLLAAMIYIVASVTWETWRVFHETPGADDALHNAYIANVGSLALFTFVTCLLLAGLAWLLARVPWST